MRVAYFDTHLFPDAREDDEEGEVEGGEGDAEDDGGCIAVHFNSSKINMIS